MPAQLSGGRRTVCPSLTGGGAPVICRRTCRSGKSRGRPAPSLSNSVRYQKIAYICLARLHISGVYLTVLFPILRYSVVMLSCAERRSGSERALLSQFLSSASGRACGLSSARAGAGAGAGSAIHRDMLPAAASRKQKEGAPSVTDRSATQWSRNNTYTRPLLTPECRLFTRA